MYSKNSPDPQLIQGCIKNDRMAQKYLYAKFYEDMLRTTICYTKDRQEAKEVLNNAFFKVFEAIETYKGAGSFEGWIRKIVINTALNYIKSKVHYESIMKFDLDDDITIEPEIFNKMSGEDILKLVQQISLPSRHVFTLFIIEGYSHKEIAELLNISEGVSKWHLLNAKKKLKEILKKEFDVESRRVVRYERIESYPKAILAMAEFKKN